MLASSHQHDTQVLIAGAGPIGLCLAIELGHHGIQCLVVEERTEPSTDPKAKYVNLRTMALLRRWGIADAVRAAAPIPSDYPSDVVYANRLTRAEIVRLIDAFSTAPCRNPQYPEHAQRIPQPAFQEVLRRHAESLPTVTLRTGCRVERVSQSQHGVEAEVVEIATGTRETIAAAYLAGCDGARSTVRRQLGIKMEGSARVAQSLGAIFRAPTLWSVLKLGKAVHYWLLNDDLPIMVGIGPLDLNGLWFFQMMDLPEGVDASEVDPRKIVTACVGHEVPIEVVDVVPWQIHKMTADRYREGRAFVLGDAAHLHSPTGGFGMNTGIGDALDLGWKLAAVLNGWGGDALLDSFEIERRPVHNLVINQSASNLANQNIHEIGLEDLSPEGEARRKALASSIVEKKTEHYRSIGLQLGYRYEDSPLVVSDHTRASPVDTVRYVPTATPGSIAPHAWLPMGKSLFDSFDTGFTLLSLGSDDIDTEELTAAARIRLLPLKIVRLPDPSLRDLYKASLVLIRPDQHVAWRSDRAPDDALEIVDQIRGALVDQEMEPTRPALGLG